MPIKYDVFCKIVDNFGDIGVCWRLCQQLSHTHQIALRLFVDDLNIASKIIPALDPSKASQVVADVTIQTWPTQAIDLPNAVIENFSCTLPATYAKQLALHNKQNPDNKISWINLDHLSAEDWVEGCHALPSTHPTLGYTRYFFYSGFTANTGGLLREENLLAQRDLFQASKPLQDAFWASQSITPTSVTISLFSYPQADITGLVNTLSRLTQPVTLLLPHNTEITALNKLIDTHQLRLNQALTIGNVTLQLLPFLSQASYDQLLWACDLNIVRGEDSWIRALWAGKPFIWQPYIQAEDAHIKKLNAFLAKYFQHFDTTALTDLIHDAHLIWSQAKTPTADHFWQAAIDALPQWQSLSMTIANRFAKEKDLSKQLVTFIQQVE